MPKPFSPASERNRGPILDILQQHFGDRRRVLEVGSGTGQHAVHFAAAMPHLRWQCSDRPAYLPGIRQWLAEESLPNTPEPLALDANDDWGRLKQRFDALFTANTLHIMSWPEVERFFAQLPTVLDANAKLAIYGPFNYGGQFTSASNAAFDATLKAEQAHRGIRDFEAVNAQAEALGFQLVQDYSMPANNRCLVWRRI
ncbi:MAG TPA: DUF938 domain-containing protein [Rhodocyclaceae bacterium]|nr:DUF938 domain-containing protein [Rhodocyclaceae bacterium]